ncbi:MAG TPA: YbaK/EbsC family protein, partial [Bacteroidales bacterium]|nr:YbaK/EbsC family protein [Bacteroidales bacterium]
MKVEDIREKLFNINAVFEIIQHDIPIKSKKDATGYFKIEETAPTLIVQTQNDFYALIISGERHKVDLELIKKLLGSKKLSLANKTELSEKFGLEAGQIPLVGHDLPCIIDKLLFKYEFVYGGTGNCFFTLKIKPCDLVKANNVIL